MSIDEAFTRFGDEDLLAEIERRVQAARESAAAAAIAAAAVAANPPASSFAGGDDEDYDEDDEIDAFEEANPPEAQRTKPLSLAGGWKPVPSVAPLPQKSIRKKESRAGGKAKLKPCPLCWSGSRKPLGHTGRHQPEPPRPPPEKKKPSAAILGAGDKCSICIPGSGKLEGHIGRHVTGDSNPSRAHNRPNAADYENYDDYEEEVHNTSTRCYSGAFF